MFIIIFFHLQKPDSLAPTSFPIKVNEKSFCLICQSTCTQVFYTQIPSVTTIMAVALSFTGKTITELQITLESCLLSTIQLKCYLR